MISTFPSFLMGFEVFVVYFGWVIELFACFCFCFCFFSIILFLQYIYIYIYIYKDRV